MIEEDAVVVRVERDQAYLEIVRRKPCGMCGQTRGCGISLWGKVFGHHQGIFTASNSINASEGDSVVVGVEERALLRSSLVAYGLPLVALLTGTALGAWLAPVATNRDLYTVLGAVVGLVFGTLWLKGHAAGHQVDARYRPVILRRAGNCSSENVCQSS